ncbi:MAG: YkgJ family cysteine cluster protein [Eubacteriales bacterium]|nr:YkgJ family cysteine cluster protein [Eubacteriales bacterium]
MRREITAEDLQKTYTSNDMVKADCGGCHGCSDCCHYMGESVVLDPMDIWRLTKGNPAVSVQLMERFLELHVVDGIVLPNLRMVGEEEACIFLNEEERCSIHEHRPGVCRLFPLGRIYEDGGFRYFLQHQECPKKEKTKIKVSKWVDTPNLKRYEKYILNWHDLLEEARTLLENKKDDQLQKDLNAYILHAFFMEPYTAEDFYPQFEARLEKIEKLMKVLQG